MSRNMSRNMSTGIWVLISTVIGFAILFVLPFFGGWGIVGAGYVGVITRAGAVDRVVEPGFVVKWPLIEAINAMETRTLKEQTEAAAASKDLQEVKATIALNYRLDGQFAVEVYQEIGTNYRERIIDPAMQEALKSTTAQFTAEELIVKREEVKLRVETHLRERLQPYHIIVDALNIVNFDFSPAFNRAIEEKQVAQQNVEREKRNLERIQVEAEQARQQAKGQADAQKILKDSGSLSPEYLQYLATTKWDGKLPNVVGGAIPFVSVPEK